MISHAKTLATLALSALAALATLAPAASAEPSSAWQISLNSHPTNFKPGQLTDSGTGEYPFYIVIAENVGAATTDEPIAITVQLPGGISPSATKAPKAGDQTYEFSGQTTGGKIGSEPVCSVSEQPATCTDINPVDPGEWVKMIVPVDISALPDPTTLSALATISGGGGGAATTTAPTTISNTIAPFGLLAGREGFNASAGGEDGAAATQAGSHPQQLNVNLGLPTQRKEEEAVHPDGTLHDVKVDLPAGMVVDPNATPKCPAALFQTFSCPDSTQVGISDIPISSDSMGLETSQVYNLEAPPGHAAAFGFYVLYVPVTILGGVRPGADPGGYRITSLTAAAPSILTIFNARLQLWGSPSDESHDGVRGKCRNNPGTCPVTRTGKPLLTLPSSCTDSMRADAHVDLWESVGSFYDRAVNLEDANGNTTPVSGCNQLQFEPTLRARPTTSVADSPTGLEAVLHVPQTDSVNQLATAHLRKAVVTLPEGVSVNPASANGLAGCSSAQVGIDPATGVPNGDPVRCPNASRIGAVEVDTPLLDHPLAGSVFVATPHDNPFDSLLAIYVTVDDPLSGTLVKLAGHVVADPNTGQLTTTFDNNPQIPFEDFKLDFFGGPTAALKTPATCGTYSTTSSLTPWSAPESGPPATPKDTYEINRAPAGGSCAALSNSPSFEAGSVNPLAGSYSAFVGRLQRADGTQPFKALNLTLPPGLSGKLAGIPACSEAAIQAAVDRTGRAELANPSCPAASQVGEVTVGAGAGPAPYYTQGKIYLAGPYKGGPVSVAIITPAVAGPYDLGTVVVRAALQIDPVSAQVRVHSDPIPSILEGIPLQVRDVRVNMGRPQFTLNPTNCDPMEVSGEAISVLDQVAPLSNRFQVADCAALPFKPKLAIKLTGGTKRGKNPSLRATLTMPPGSANVAKASVALPHSEFLDQSHIRTVCTRVQFAAGAGGGAQCPAGAVYGQARAFTPLLDEPLQGPVYLRSSSHALPDLVAALRGPARQPIEVVLAGRVDSVNGGIRNTFEAVPDQPVSKFVLEMQGGKKGLLVNSRDLCTLKASARRASAKFDGQNGKAYDFKPVVRNSCKKKHHKKHG